MQPASFHCAQRRGRRGARRYAERICTEAACRQLERPRHQAIAGLRCGFGIAETTCRSPFAASGYHRSIIAKLASDTRENTDDANRSFVALPALPLDAVARTRCCEILPHAQVFVWPGAGARPLADASRAQGIPVADERISTRTTLSRAWACPPGLRPSGWPDSWAGDPGHRPAGDRVRPAAAVRLRSHVEGVADHRAAATALLSADSAKPANGLAATLLAWERALAAVQSRRRKAAARWRAGTPVDPAAQDPGWT